MTCGLNCSPALSTSGTCIALRSKLSFISHADYTFEVLELEPASPFSAQVIN